MLRSKIRAAFEGEMTIKNDVISSEREMGFERGAKEKSFERDIHAGKAQKISPHATLTPAHVRRNDTFVNLSWVGTRSIRVKALYAIHRHYA